MPLFENKSLENIMKVGEKRKGAGMMDASHDGGK
jgi:hypothetical protein